MVSRAAPLNYGCQRERSFLSSCGGSYRDIGGVERRDRSSIGGGGCGVCGSFARQTAQLHETLHSSKQQQLLNRKKHHQVKEDPVEARVPDEGGQQKI